METWWFIIYLTAMMTVTLSQTKDDHPVFQPADIFVSPTVKAGDNVTLKCSIFDKSVSGDQLHMYLCKNGVGLMMEPLGKKDEHVFILRNVSVLDSGKYSCVYSIDKYPLNDVSTSGQKSGHKSIHVQDTVGEKNMNTNEQNNDQVQLSVSLEYLLILLLVLLLAVILFLGMYRNRSRMFTKLCHNQEQSGQDNTGHCEVQVTQAVNRTESFDDMCEYSTIPEFNVSTSPGDACYAESGVYSLAQGSAVYSVAEHPDVKIDSEQPSSVAVYAKVQKRKKKIAHDEFFMYE
ncbi:uncharacterized protein LOC118818463 isoform X2 [Colossoma macropomum]|uniref:uncharacterized protein LOC118818463 isoform X2 n=1 Tax=Colossoma macropomum TaxID=42526 RepID=UPI001863CAD3|nr:uncharacterized protein LOC118818463 isoform X2 [Colossoma macropomum]